MNSLNLLKLLYAFGNKGIEKCDVYGRITRRLEKPSNLIQDMIFDPDGIFVEVSVFAVGLKYHESYLKSCGYYNKDSVYMVNGDLVAFVKATDFNDADWYQVRGTLRLGSREPNCNYVCLFGFYKKDNKWMMPAYNVYDLEIGDWDRHSDYFSWINESANQNRVVHPSELSGSMRFVSQYNVIKEQTPISEKPVEEIKTTINTVVPTGSFNKECRTSVKSGNEMVEKFQSKLDDAKSTKHDYINSLIDDYSKKDSDKYISRTVSGIQRFLKNKPMQMALTGRGILQKYLSNFGKCDDNYMGTTVSKYLIDVFDEVSNYILDHDAKVACSGVAWDVCKSAFGDSHKFYAGVVSIVLGFSFEEMNEVKDTCEDNGLDFVYVVNENPYILQFVSNLSFDSIEKIALCFGKHNDSRLDAYRNIALLNDYINSSNNQDTVFKKDSMVNSGIGIKLSKYRYNTMVSTGTYLTRGTYENINAFLRSCDIHELGYEPRSFTQTYGSYIKKLSASDVTTAIKDYEESGFGIILDNWLTSTKVLDKELFVYNFMKDLGSKTFDYDVNEIDKYIKEYEAEVGFTLEERQRMAVHLLVNAGFIVAGGAGSGKTTVSNCIVYVLGKLEPSLEMKFATPTGKSAKRMQEVVHKDVKTLHSTFKIGIGSSYDLKQEDESSDFGRVAFFFDEGAMVTIDLLYSVLKKIEPEDSRIFLFGDFDQLPPIGKGLPFKNLLRFMPCVFLNVSKRAAEGSNITASSNIINEYSQPDNWQSISSGKDFFLMNCQSNQIQRVVYDLCAYYLGKKRARDIQYICDYLDIDKMPEVDNLEPDDIQVVTPLAKDTYSWGSHRLNEILQPLFNPLKGYTYTFVYQVAQNMKGNSFIINDRVIHVDKNMYSMQWYSSYKNGNFQKIYGCGICNGEVGKLVGFFKADTCHIYDEVEEKPDDFEYYSSLRDDKSWHGDGKWFVVVEYYDYIGGRNIYILYRAEENTKVQSNIGVVFKGTDITRLNLFYAGTTHKLQGSQAKLVICPLDKVNYSGFITRQMIYTMFTRGESLVFAVGSVGNERDSMLSKARQDIASVDVKTIGEIIIS